MRPLKGQLGGWLRLGRIPNLFTVPGDPIAGALVAGGADDGWAAAGLAVAVSMLLYLAGLIMNDLVDIEEDRRDRPMRPLPSGEVSPRAAGWVAGILVLLALICAALAGGRVLFLGSGLAGLIFAYNMWCKSSGFLGPLVLGACRGMSFLLGAAAVSFEIPTVAIALAGVACLYIFLVSTIAHGEMDRIALHPAQRFAPTVVPLILIVFLAVQPSSFSLIETRGLVEIFSCFTLLLVWLGIALTAGKRAVEVPRAVGILIRCLLVFQAAVCAWTGPTGMGGTLVFILAYPCSARLGKTYYAS